MTAPNFITEERLEHAVRHMARIVSLHGPAYLPILERLGSELVAMRQRRDQLLQVMNSLEPPTIDLQPIKREPAA